MSRERHYYALIETNHSLISKYHGKLKLTLQIKQNESTDISKNKTKQLL